MMGIPVCESLMVEDLIIILILQDRKIIKNVISLGKVDIVHDYKVYMALKLLCALSKGVKKVC